MLKRLELVNFRNLEPATLEFSKEVNIIWGKNAQGKTNLLEAICLLSTGKSFRAQTDQELISWQAEKAKIVGQADPLQIELLITKTGKKLLVNRQSKRLIELVGEFIIVLFSPEDLLLLSGSPSLRRSWLNSLIARLDRNYLFNLAKYNRLLKHRNQLLFLASQGRKVALEVWDEQLSELAAFLWITRKAFVEKINLTLKTLSAKLGVEKIFLEYKPQIEITGMKETKERFAKVLRTRRDEEIKRGQTLVGPQRDDFKIIFEIALGQRLLAKDIGVFGSRGEQRAAVLSLKLTELELIQAEKGKRPTLLLDDILSEFDEEHREMIQKLLYRQQSFLTTTSLEILQNELFKKAKIFQVRSGKVSEFNAPAGGKESSV